MPYYALFGEVVMDGIVRVEPMGGFDGTATAYYLQLTCDVCRGETAKEICLFPDHPCPHHLGQMAFCKDCGSLGSVSLIPGKGKALTPDSKNMVNGDQHELHFSKDGFEGYGDNDELILTSAKFTVERLKKAEKMSFKWHIKAKDRANHRLSQVVIENNFLCFH
ncbi:Os06g0645200 [Oryza sativa Japonica Group]|uniref:Os06g0645200 protein n=1 Tax=Oryza sativa subsp. japonica TaxID=39947 RepID=A0A0P0WZQ6_ORYSJ|nr:Os06g0645200 [Oryza sativa Japonica Group]